MSKQPMNRRDFLKVIIASGAGLTASSFVPSKWMKPLVNSGVMPVHAQTSVNYYLSAENGKVTSLGNALYIFDIAAFVTSNPSADSGTHAKLAAPARLSDGIAGISVTMTFQNNGHNPDPNIAPHALPRKEVTNDPDGKATFGQYTFTGNGLDFSLVFSAPGCTEQTLGPFLVS